MKNLQITFGVEINGKHHDEGAVVENVDNVTAAELISAGRAVEVPKRAVAIDTRDPEPVNRDPQPAAKPAAEPAAVPAEKSKETGKPTKPKRPAKAG